jgi:hypothetical protein
LPNLIGLCLVTLSLQIDLLFHARFPENMVTAISSHVKTKAQQEMAQIRKTDICVRCPTEYLSHKPRVFAHVIISPVFPLHLLSAALSHTDSAIRG